MAFTEDELKYRRQVRREIVRCGRIYYLKANTQTGLSDLCSPDIEWCHWIVGAPNKFQNKPIII